MAPRVCAVFLDLYGTVLLGKRWLPGAKELIRLLLARGVAVRFLSNATLHSRTQLNDIFRAEGFTTSAEWFFTPAHCFSLWYQGQSEALTVLPLVHSNLLPDLSALNLSQSESAQLVLVGDPGNDLSMTQLTLALRALRCGARLIALSLSRYWHAAEGVVPDAGFFVRGLEFASGAKCESVFGKPSRVFFEMAIRDAGTAPHEILMIGDDFNDDIVGAQGCGMRGCLVRTTKESPAAPSQEEERADLFFSSLQELSAWLEQNR